MPIRDEDGHRAMQAAGKAWKAIKTSGAKTWREWTEVIGPGLVMVRALARSRSPREAARQGERADDRRGQPLDRALWRLPTGRAERPDSLAACGDGCAEQWREWQQTVRLVHPVVRPARSPPLLSFS